MSKPQTKKPKSPQRGVLARPLEALVFLLPLIIFYEFVSQRYPDRVVAFNLVLRFFELFGSAGILAPGLAVVAILGATHAASREPWVVRWHRVGLMYVEALVLAAPLLVLDTLLPLAASVISDLPLLNQVAIGIGAGVYEELVFRLVFLSIVVMIGVDMLRIKQSRVAVFAIIFSSLVFAAHHHYPIGEEPFSVRPFVFRSLAGAYLAIVFWFRGYGPAAGCHAAYNVLLVTVAYQSE